MDSHVSGLGQPAHGCLVQLLERSEGAAIQQVGFQVIKRSLDFAFRFRTARPAGPWLKTVMRGEGKKASIINRLITVIIRHDHFHVVVEAGGRQSLKIFECANVFADGGCKILRLHKAQVLAA